MKYDKEHFINKFEAIPDELWTIGTYMDNQNRRCALGHCDAHIGFNDEVLALLSILQKVMIATINDGKDPKYQQATPKARILAALKDLP